MQIILGVNTKKSNQIKPHLKSKSTVYLRGGNILNNKYLMKQSLTQLYHPSNGDASCKSNQVYITFIS